MNDTGNNIPLDAFVRRISREVEHGFKVNDGSIPMMVWFAVMPSDEIAMLATLIENDDDKDVVAAGMRAFFWEHKVTRYAMIAEAWGSKSSRPAEDPERIELVTIHAEDGLEQIHAMREIVRPAGRKPYLAKLEILDSGGTRGRFTNLGYVAPDTVRQ